MRVFGRGYASGSAALTDICGQPYAIESIDKAISARRRSSRWGNSPTASSAEERTRAALVEAERRLFAGARPVDKRKTVKTAAADPLGGVAWARSMNPSGKTFSGVLPEPWRSHVESLRRGRMFGGKIAFEAWRWIVLVALLADGVADPTEAQIAARTRALVSAAGGLGAGAGYLRQIA